MRYFGSKASTIERVYDLIGERIPSGTFCDPFGGIGIVGSYFKKQGYSVWCGDILTVAHFFQTARVQRNSKPIFKGLIKALNLRRFADILDLLNTEQRKNGWFVREYAQKRRFFTIDNAARIEACRVLINKWSSNQWVSKTERAILLASLVNCMDKVANTAGTYYAYLKTWHRKALQPFRFDILPHTEGNPDCHSFLCEAKHLVGLRPHDILYLDPPYNERSYASYYHLPETIALGKTPKTHGKSGMPNSVRPLSDFNKARQARNALEELLKSARFRLLAFHYSNDGLIPPEEVRQILASCGQIEEFIIDSQGYSTATRPRRVKHCLYLVNHG